jgi:hypothetical protein
MGFWNEVINTIVIWDNEYYMKPTFDIIGNTIFDMNGTASTIFLYHDYDN